MPFPGITHFLSCTSQSERVRSPLEEGRPNNWVSASINLPPRALAFEAAAIGVVGPRLNSATYVWREACLLLCHRAPSNRRSQVSDVCGQRVGEPE